MSASSSTRSPAADRRLAEFLAPLSLVTDLGMGAPDEDAMRACLVATALARTMGLPETAVSDVYYATMLKHLGCTATAVNEAIRFGGDELASRRAVGTVDFGRPREIGGLITRFGADRGFLTRGRMVTGALTGKSWGAGIQRAVCEVGALVARRLEMSDEVVRGLSHMFERWDGKGEPGRRAGDDIAPPARFAQVAARAVAFHRAGGIEAAIESVRVSSGGWFDPAIAAAFVEHARELLAGLDEMDVQAAMVEAEPQPWRTVRPEAIDEAVRAFADIADLKSQYTLGHSPAVAGLVAGACERLGIASEEAAGVRHAAYLQDIGKIGVPAGTWERQGALSTADMERIRLHPYYSERILSRIPALAGIARLAGLHHERLDGSGYHRGCLGSELSPAARLLGAADCFQTMVEERPHRRAKAPDEAAATLGEEARQGRLCPDAVAALLGAPPPPPRRRELPAGLSEREVEVLRLLARGRSNREIASALVISPRTAEHHVQNIYGKIGLSTRAGATVFAMQHDLIRPG